ncbi:DUF4012 domain-containing protein [Arthrobacter zhaoxinii]|uniref:DUF4012 domain-containing protein n=1 Tax=Arthrobacter zhaoxinii TaxID=2964616 RepID=UPI002105B1DB|nr:DUF4012 domain-containing protein [Arthrobacter zhaoxinii]MCQ2001771.1 DUF4012 domain-containing protein [Arthrobacter zhaoxinii]
MSSHYRIVAEPEASGAAQTTKRRKWPIGRGQLLYRVAIALLSLLIFVGAGIGLVARQVLAVRTDLETVFALVPSLRADLGASNYDGANQAAAQIQDSTASARSIVTGPLWKAAAAVPLIGANFAAVAEVAVSADDVAAHAISPLVDRYKSLDWATLTPTDGRIDVSQVKDAEPSISTAANTVRMSHDRLKSIDLSRLRPEIADPIRSATEQLGSVSTTLGTASSAAQLLPEMLGTNGERNYLVLVQNSAETRATGGIPGALAMLTTDDGRISLSDQSSAAAIEAFKPALEVDEEEERLYTARLGTQMQNVNLTPHFPTAAETAKRMWEGRHPGQIVDGVLALDPVVLGHLLEATGPVDLADPSVVELVGGTQLPISLTKDNVVNTLLSDVYREIEEPAAQDAYFAAVAARVFSAFTGGQGDSKQLISALGTSVQENRLYLWSSIKNEQDIISSTALAGSVTGPTAGGATFGAYFNDGTGAKMDYYASRTAQLMQTCDADGYSRYTVQLKVANTAPEDAATSLPAYVTGDGVFGVEPGHFRTNYVVYGPAQSLVEAAQINGNSVAFGAGKHGQRPVGTVTLELAPGETAVIDIEFSRVVQSSEPKLEVTPSTQALQDVALPAKRDGSCD